MNALPVSQNVANRQHPCLPSKKGRWHAWYNFFACCTVFRYSCLYNSETIPSRDGGDCECVEAFTVALPSFQSLTPCTNPSKTALFHPLFVMPTSICTIRFQICAILFAFRRGVGLPLPLHRILPFPHNHCKRTTIPRLAPPPLPPLSKGGGLTTRHKP